MVRIIVVALCGLAVASSAWAGQIQKLPDVVVPYADVKPAADGRTDGWKESAKLRIDPVPVSRSLERQGGWGKAEADLSDLSETVSVCYDDDALYVGGDETGQPAPVDGDRVTLHVHDSRVTLAFMLGGAVSASVERRSVKTAIEGGKWTGGADNRTFSWTVRVPWSVIASDGQMLSKPFGIAVERTWAALSSEKLAAMPLTRQLANVFDTMCCLAAKPTPGAKQLQNPAQWGTVVFGKANEAAMERCDTPFVADATRVGCPLADGTWKDADFAESMVLPVFLGKRESIRSAFKFDEKALYARIRFSHPTGTPRNAALASTKAGFGGGDALQLRLSDGKDFKASVCAWFDTAAGRTALTADGSEHGDGDLLKVGAKCAIAPCDGGYEMGLEIPWKAFLRHGAKVPVAGTEWQMTLQPWWAQSGTGFVVYTTASLRPTLPLSIAYDMPRDGALSLGVFDNEGRLLRQVLKYEFRAKGRQVERWDGLDQFGKPIPAGSYAFRGIVTDTHNEEYQFTLLHPGNPKWPTMDGRGDWLSDEAPPQGMATDGERIFVAAPGSEAATQVMSIDANGQRLWGSPAGEAFPRTVSLSEEGGILYMLESGPIRTNNNFRSYHHHGAMERAVLKAYDAQTGRRIPVVGKEIRVEVGSRWEYREDAKHLGDLLRTMTLSPEVYLGQPRYWCDGLGETTGAPGLAVTKKRIVIAKMYEKRLECYDRTTLELEKSIALEGAPVGLCREAGEAVLAVVGKSIVRVSLDDGKIATVVKEGMLEAPVCVTKDSKGFIYATDWGASHDVKKFSPDGTLVRTIGKKGGRPFKGRFDEGGMLIPHGLAVVGESLFVAEADLAPRRISRWHAETGAFEKNWLGAMAYCGATQLWFNPPEDDVIHLNGCKLRVDWKKGAWSLEETEFRPLWHDEVFMPNPEYGMFNGRMATFSRGGRDYLAISRSKQSVVLGRDKGGAWKAVAAIGCLHRMVTTDGSDLAIWDSDLYHHCYKNYYPPFFKGHAGDNYTWSDANGDGRVQPEEMMWKHAAGRGDAFDTARPYEAFGTPGFIGDGTHYFLGFGKETSVYRLKPKDWSAYGPVYDIADVETIYHEAGSHLYSALMVDDDENLIISQGTETASMRYPIAARKIDRNGKVLWTIASSPSNGDKSFATSGFNALWHVKGIGQVYCAWNWWWNNRPYFMSEDGLLVGSALKASGGGPEMMFSESSKYFIERADGSRYIVNGGNNSAHVIRILDFDHAQRFNDTLAISAKDAERVNAMLAREKVRELPKPEVGVFAFAPGSVAVDGSFAEWEKCCAPFSVLEGKSGRGARVALALEGDSLVVAADVKDATPLVMTGTSPEIVFTTGDCVDIMLATDDAANPNRRVAAVGDMRISIAASGEDPMAVLFEPVTNPRSEKPSKLMAASFDRIVRLENAVVKAVRTAGGYRLEAKIPLSAIGLSSADLAGKALKGDVGVIFHDGERREERLYHYNKKTAMLTDLTTEATLQPSEWGTVLFPLGVNILKNGSFESPLGEDKATGWKADIQSNGATAEGCDAVAASGSSCLKVYQSVAVTFDGKALADTDYRAFIQSANGGKGSGHASVGQIAAIKPGNYALRLRYRAEGMQIDEKRPGKANRGYAGCQMMMVFKDAKGAALGRDALWLRTNAWEWQTVNPALNSRNGGELIHVPDGAESVIIDFKFTNARGDANAAIWIDDIELVKTVQKEAK